MNDERSCFTPRPLREVEKLAHDLRVRAPCEGVADLGHEELDEATRSAWAGREHHRGSASSSARASWPGVSERSRPKPVVSASSLGSCAMAASCSMPGAGEG